MSSDEKNWVIFFLVVFLTAAIAQGSYLYGKIGVYQCNTEIIEAQPLSDRASQDSP